jgi:hypothetical protein
MVESDPMQLLGSRVWACCARLRTPNTSRKNPASTDEIDQSCVLSYATELNTGIWEREMKVAEALAHRADLQRRLEQLKQRLVKNARVQEGDLPAEVPGELQTEFERCAGSK